MYEVARSKSIGPPLAERVEEGTGNDKADLLTLMSGQLYSDVIAGDHGLRKINESPSPPAPINNPYIISFYDAYM
jgi:hypothetical protein